MSSTAYSDAVLLAIVSMAVYMNAWKCRFVFDDVSAIVNNRHIRTNETTWLSVFGTDYWGTDIASEHSHKSYRPLTVLTFRLNYLVNGLEPYGYHIVNVLLHLLVTQLYHRFSLQLLSSRRISLMASIFFAVHPLKTEAVTGVVGRAELLATVFFLISLMAYMNSKYHIFVVSVICAILSKEQGLTVLAVCVTYEMTKCFQRRPPPNSSIKKSLFITTLLTIFASILLAFRIYIMGGPNQFPVFTKFDNPASFEPYPTRQLTYNYLLSLNSWLMLYPFRLCCDWTMKSIVLISDIYDQRNIWTLIFYTVFILLAIRSLVNLFRYRNHCLIIALSLIVFPFIPASNLVFPVGFVIAERTLYIPSTGYSLLMAIGIDAIENRYFNRLKIKKFLLIIYCLTIAMFCLKTQSRNEDWSDELSLFSSAIKVNKNNAKLYNNIGHHYERQKQYEEALKYFEKAADQQIDDLGSQINIARTLINLGQQSKAEQMLWKLKPKVKLSAINNRIVPNYLNLWINLANIIVRNETRLSEAESLYKELIQMRSDFIEAYINLGDVLIRQSKLSEAIDVYHNGLLLNRIDRKADLYFNLGVVHSMILKNMDDMSDKRTETVRLIADYFLNATVINVNHKESIVNLAILFQKHESILSSYRQTLIDLMMSYTGTETELVYYNLALLFADSGDNLMAIHYLKEAVRLKPNFRSALFNLALIFLNNYDYNEAEAYLRRLIDYYPDNTKSLLLIGNLYVNHLNDLERARQSYGQVLKYNESNVEAMHNLCVVLHKQNETKRANDCFQSYHLRQQQSLNKSQRSST
ncbi:protein O-mannosyl-transferase Tmtc3-like [Oppia nitens]|uniref:protein O-mannosyl-transferase Tmtc3-like n=1 Tax=Oppia nitens TaxID=1686743 RepID=UPI0023DB5CE2|nr:protein O-mannosyl-transferase Tmtc3-like [Oppia nitens]